MPLTWRRVLLVAGSVAGFALLFPVPAVRRFCALALPYGHIGVTLLIAALGAAVLGCFWALSRRSPRAARDQ
jgi:hypothetical protein